MRSILIATAILAISGANALLPAPKITVDFANPPKQRWQKAVELVINTHGWEPSFGGFFGKYWPIIDLLPKSALATLKDSFQTRFPTHYQELEGIMEQIHSMGYAANMNMTQFCALPWVYELSHINASALETEFADYYPLEEATVKAAAYTKVMQGHDRACTGILSLPLNKSEEIIHGRNLDESPHQCRNFTLDITVVNGSKYLYQIFDYTWASTGMFTSNRVASAENNFNGITLEENWRNVNNPSFGALFKRIAEKDTIPIALLNREIQMQTMTFEQATNYLMNVQVASPGYFIVSGSGRKGAVLTLSFDAINNRAEYVNDTTLTTQPWIVQTNYDFWQPDPIGSRRWTAQQALKMMGPKRAATEMGVWMAISTYPVHNPTTLFTAMMRPDRETEGYIRQPMVPDRHDM